MLDAMIAAAIADGAPVEESMPAARRVVTALTDAGLLVAPAPVYEPKQYPKWVGNRIARNAAEEAAMTAPVVPVAVVPASEPVAPVPSAPPVTTEPVAPVAPPALTVVPTTEAPAV